MTWLLCVFSLLAAAASAEPAPAKGRLLVATEVVGGDLFSETVILLLEYSDAGAMGLVVNRPTEVGLGELLEDSEEIPEPPPTVYWGGPVEMSKVSALGHKGGPDGEGADEVIESVYRLPFDEALENAAADPASVRFYLGYAGWAPGQLDYEMARDSWHVLPASDELVFSEDPKQLWQRLRPAQEYRAAVQSIQEAGHSASEASDPRIVPE